MPKANQNKLLQMMGETQQMTFYRKRNGEYALRRKGGITAEQYANDPRFELARANARDFARATKAASLIKSAFATITPPHATSDLYERLASHCKMIVKSDLQHDQGSRNLLDGNIELFKSFEFTTDNAFRNVVRFQPVYTVDRAAGTVTVELPEHVPAESILSPKKATHYKIRVAASAVDFVAGEPSVASYADSPEMVIENIAKAAQTLTVKIPANTKDPVFVVALVDFFTTDNEKLVQLYKSKFKLMKMIGVDLSV